MMVALGNLLFRYRNGLFPLAFLIALYPGPRLFADPVWAALAGGAVALLGQAVRAGTIGLRYIIRGGRQGKVYAEDLVTEGVYGLCRNPMYVGNILIATGVALASNAWTTVAAAVPLSLLAYIAIVAAEEVYLAAKFGPAYAEYCANVPRWIPRAKGLGDSLSVTRFHWRRVVAKEYGTPFGWITVICLMLVLNLWRDGTLRQNPATLNAALAVFLTALILWIVARYLKKSRMLVAD